MNMTLYKAEKISQICLANVISLRNIVTLWFHRGLAPVIFVIKSINQSINRETNVYRM